MHSEPIPVCVSFENYKADYDLIKNIRVKFSDNTLQVTIDPKILALDPLAQRDSLFWEARLRTKIYLGVGTVFLSGAVFAGRLFYQMPGYIILCFRVSCLFVSSVFVYATVHDRRIIRLDAMIEARISKEMLKGAKKTLNSTCIERIYTDTLAEDPNNEERRKRLWARLNLHYGERTSKDIIWNQFSEVVNTVVNMAMIKENLTEEKEKLLFFLSVTISVPKKKT